MNRKIVSDSSCDLQKLLGLPIQTAPLKIITDNKEYTDDETLSVYEMVEDLQKYKGRSSTSCPNVEDWLNVFGDAHEIFCVTITGTLSGSYHSACLARDLYEELYPGKRVFVLDSLSTGPEMALLLEKLGALLKEDKSFDEICGSIRNYQQHTGLLFVLESMKNLANNGRVNPLTAKMAGLLGIRVVGRASEKGDLEALSKCRGEKKALDATVEHMSQLGYQGGEVLLHHCFNEEAAKNLKAHILEKFPQGNVRIAPCRGLCSFYAEKGGLLIGFEKG